MEKEAGRSSPESTSVARENSAFAEAPSISLPKGGGAIRGIDEKFAVNPVTGTGAMTVPIAVSPGRAGFSPQLSLSYDSGAGNGPFGLGWNLALPAITRKTDKGLPRYFEAEASDEFILSGAEDLVPVLEEINGEWTHQTLPSRTVDGRSYRIQRYRPRIEGLFARIERWTNQVDPSDSFWRSISRDNITTWYGKTAESRIADPANHSRIFSWLICESYDDKGNVISYGYKQEDSVNIVLTQVHEANRTDDSRSANLYLKCIRYGNHTPYVPELSATEPTTPLPSEWMFEVVFDYGEHDPDNPLPSDNGDWAIRNDPFSSYRAGFEIRTYRLCQRVLMFHHFPHELGVGENCLVRSTDFDYRHEQDPTDPRNPIHSVLTSVTPCAYTRVDGSSYRKRTLPPVEFEYSQAQIHEKIRVLNDDSLENLPQGLDHTLYRWIDLDGEGLSGILTEQGAGWFYKRNLSPVNVETNSSGQTVTTARLAPLEQVSAMPSLAALDSGRQQLLDLAGDGQLDLVAFDGHASGFFERTFDGSWNPFKTFESLPVLNWSDPNLKFVDLTGDGHADILMTEHEAICWHPSLAEAGFGARERVHQVLDEEQGPRLVFADSTESIYLADFSGDGLTDLVRIRNGAVCYWPNLGYGQFGAKVTMDNAPWFDTPDTFDQRRIQLADIDGSGITDILYLRHDEVAIYYNQSGNRWSDARLLHHLPRIDNLSSVQAIDLLGNGTACLVWSSPLPGDARQPMRYIDLMGGQKPHLMIGSRNNLGAETRVHYAPSTKFYVQDRLDGNPWITRVPFPVHVVERIETYDHISRNRFVTRYAYHHGYFDGAEREFRGFGRVDQWDTEAFGALSAAGEFPAGDNIDATSHMPPVLTRTWFHTGAFLDRDRISRLFADEYYAEPAALLLSDTVLPSTVTLPGGVETPWNLSPAERREACRALRGSMLRQEVYGLDGSVDAAHPYTVVEHNYTLKLLQPQAQNRHAVFFTHAREALSNHYERNPADPRVSHALTLAVDDFGNVLTSAAIGYGRREPDPDLSLADQARQTELLMSCTENTYTNAVDDDDSYRTKLPSEALSYELTGLILNPDQVRFSFADMQECVQAAVPIAYHQTPTGSLQKRLLERVRTLYRPDDMGSAQNDPLALLPLGVVQPLALPGESYQLAFAPEHLGLIFGDRVTESMLSDEGRYVHLDGDDNWWIPSGRVFMSPNIDDGAAQELAFAQQHFFTPHRYLDPFGQTTTVTFDTYDLLMLETRDPLNNRVTAGERDATGSISPRINYRVLQPELLTDPNGNRSAVTFDVLGLVSGTAVTGKSGENVGEPLTAFQTQFQADLDQTDIDAFFANPRGPLAIELLGNATSRLMYDETRFQRLEQPAFVAIIVRETHVSDLDGEESVVQVSFAYSDGFGREIQKKVQAEPGPIPRRDEEGLIIIGPDGQPEMTEDDVSPRWTTTGWTIFNNKGNPVKQYEPFFSDNHEFEFGVTVGVSPTLFYDPVGRVVATLHPNHTWEKVIFDPWREASYDVNDTVLINPGDDPEVGAFFRRLPEAEYLPTWHALRADPAHTAAALTKWPDAQQRQDEANAAAKAAAHADTPAVVHFDSLGRPFLSIADNGPDGAYQTRTEQDIEGNPRRIIDDRGNVVMAYQVEANGNPPVLGYDVAGRQLYENSMDAGERRVLPDIGGNLVRSWDSRSHTFRTEYDELRRPVRLFVTGADPDDPDREILFQRTVYGEGQGDALNHRGRVFQVFDGAGVLTSVAYDFKGNLLRSSRQLLVNYKDAVDWSLTPALEADEVFFSDTTYDALNRPVTLTAPDNSVTLPVYNEANLLEQMSVRFPGADQPTPFVANIDYNARGQRVRIDYATTDGTNVTTTYTYDAETFRLMRLHTVRHRDNGNLQDLNYAYDPVGNITSIRDNAQQTVFFSNTQVEPHNDYTYDALYRLIRAEGREHAVQNNLQRDATDFNPIIGIPFPNSPEALQRYVEAYTYDGVGNILSTAHTGGSVLRWKRCYQYAQDSNRLLATGGPDELPNPEAPCPAHYVPMPTLSQRYECDPHGNMTRMPHLPLMQWDFKDQLQATSSQVVNDGTPETTYYVYDAGGQRVCKVTERQASEGETPTRRKERIYIGGFEIYREYNGNGNTVTLERETLHVMDDQQRIAQIDTRVQGNDDAPPQSRRFQLSNHLGSAVLEIDDQANIISYEEYHPYGTSAYRAGRSEAEGSLKRYRYTGKERDEETWLYYHEARYYACWLGRWTAVDPIGLGDGLNLYQYTRGAPVSLLDPFGRASCDPDDLNCTLHPDDYSSNLGTGMTEEDEERLANTVGEAVPEGIPITEVPGYDPDQDPRNGTRAGRFAAGATKAVASGVVAVVAAYVFSAATVLYAGSALLGVYIGSGEAEEDVKATGRTLQGEGTLEDAERAGGFATGVAMLAGGGIRAGVRRAFSRGRAASKPPPQEQSFTAMQETIATHSESKVITSLPHETIPAPSKPASAPTNPRIPEPVARPIAPGESAGEYGNFVEKGPMRAYMERTYPNAEYQLLPRGPDVVPKHGLNFSIGEIKPILRDPGVARRQINRWMRTRKWKLLDIQPGSTRFFLYDKHTGRMYEGVQDVKLNWRD